MLLLPHFDTPNTNSCYKTKLNIHGCDVFHAQNGTSIPFGIFRLFVYYTHSLLPPSWRVPGPSVISLSLILVCSQRLQPSIERPPSLPLCPRLPRVGNVLQIRCTPGESRGRNVRWGLVSSSSRRVKTLEKRLPGTSLDFLFAVFGLI
jgi:hypothetical protein